MDFISGDKESGFGPTNRQVPAKILKKYTL